jgi:hypothetical protein
MVAYIRVDQTQFSTGSREDNATTIPSELVLDYYDIRLDYWQYFMPLFVFIIVFRSLSYITLKFVQKPV